MYTKKIVTWVLALTLTVTLSMPGLALGANEQIPTLFEPWQDSVPTEAQPVESEGEELGGDNLEEQAAQPSGEDETEDGTQDADQADQADSGGADGGEAQDNAADTGESTADPLSSIPAPTFEVSAPSALMMEASSGKILYEKEAQQRRPIASVTKIMTLLLAMEAIDAGKISLDDTLTCSEHAAGMGGSQIYLEPGEQMSLDDLLKCVVVSSANDGATMIAEYIAGSEDGFVALMNQRAAELGMENTHFVDCSGLTDSDDHYSCAQDVAIMSQQLIGHEKIFDYTTIWMDEVRGGEFGLANTNKLLKTYDGINGLKTGSTSKAFYCLSATAKRDDMQLIAVVLGAPTSKERFNDASTILDYGFANYEIAHTADTAAQITPVPVLKGDESEIMPELSGGDTLLVPKGGRSAMVAEVRLQPDVAAPIEKGQVLGQIRYTLNGGVVATIDLKAPRDVEKLTILKLFSQLVQTLAMRSGA